ncbi:MAG: ribosome biogenesis factor YjgA [Burkholderiales bacterium]
MIVQNKAWLTGDDDAPEYDGPSKTQRKNDAHALQTLGAALVALNRERLSQIDLPESLRDAVLAAQRITAHEGRRRQLQFIGKLMRNVDPAPIQARLDEWNSVSKEQIAHLHHIERWRDRLLAEPGALGELATEFPHADLQQLRTLIRNTQREREQSKPPKNYRALFQSLRELMAKPSQPIEPAEKD